MRAVLDTNVIISGLLSRGGPPHQVFQAWRQGAFELITTPALLAEMERVLVRAKIARRVRWSARRQASFIQILRRRATLVEPLHELLLVTEDPADNRVLEAAVEGPADYIVTGDHHLLELKHHSGTRVVTPAEFIVILSAEASNP